MRGTYKVYTINYNWQGNEQTFGDSSWQFKDPYVSNHDNRNCLYDVSQKDDSVLVERSSEVRSEGIRRTLEKMLKRC